jgi:hypothetical protein
MPSFSVLAAANAAWPDTQRGSWSEAVAAPKPLEGPPPLMASVVYCLARIDLAIVSITVV